MDLNRRQLLQSTAALAGGASAVSRALRAAPADTPGQLPLHEIRNKLNVTIAVDSKTRPVFGLAFRTKHLRLPPCLLSVRAYGVSGFLVSFICYSPRLTYVTDPKRRWV